MTPRNAASADSSFGANAARLPARAAAQAPSNSRRPAACRAQRAARFAVPPPSAKPTKPCTAERPPSRAAAALAGKSPVRPSAEEAAGADADTSSARPAARAEAGSSSRASSNATVMAIARSTGVTSDRPSPYSSQRSASHASNVVTMVPKKRVARPGNRATAGSRAATSSRTAAGSLFASPEGPSRRLRRTLAIFDDLAVRRQQDDVVRGRAHRSCGVRRRQHVQSVFSHAFIIRLPAFAEPQNGSAGKK